MLHVMYIANFLSFTHLTKLGWCSEVVDEHAFPIR